jgi:ribonuclease HI
LLNNQPFNSAVAFTDGSCSGNPGPCGSGAIIFHKKEQIELKRAVSNRGSILLAEIIAIKIVLDYFINSKDQELHNITIFSESISSWYSYFKLEK